MLSGEQVKMPDYIQCQSDLNQHSSCIGSLPTELGRLSTSHTLNMDFRYNKLTGTIPSELGGLTNLAVLALDGNSDLSGTMPGEICVLASGGDLESLSLDCTAVSCENDACDLGDGELACICSSDDADDDDDDDYGY